MSDDATPPAWAEAMEARLHQDTRQATAALGQEMTGLHQGLRQDMTTLRRDILAHIDGRTAGIMARLDGHKARLDGIHDDIKTNFARADRVDARSRALE